MIKPKRLEKGNTIAIIAPSGGLSALFPHRLNNAKLALERLGFKIKLYPTTQKFNNGKAGTKDERIKDILDAFKDKKVKAIICAIGGICNNELLNDIDYEIIKQNPKIFIGYSDNTLLHYAFFKKAKLITFYGPCAITQFAEYPKLLSYTKNHFLKALIKNKPLGKIMPSKFWTDELLDWSQKLDLTRARKLNKNEGYIWLKNGKISGDIVGGCLYSLLQLKGTDFDIDYTNKILFIETPEGQDFTKGEPLPYVESQIVDLKNAGVLGSIKGLIIGRPFGYSNEDKEKLKKVILEHTKEYDFPILFNVDIGHTDPMITLPLNIKVSLDSEENIFSIEESGVID